MLRGADPPGRRSWQISAEVMYSGDCYLVLLATAGGSLLVPYSGDLGTAGLPVGPAIARVSLAWQKLTLTMAAVSLPLALVFVAALTPSTAQTAQAGAGAVPLPTTGSSPCDGWQQLLNHNAVNSKVEATCTTGGTGAAAPSAKPPCYAANVAAKSYYLLGHSEDFASCLLLAQELIPEEAAGLDSAVPGGRVCKVVTWHNPSIPAPYTKTCYCGVTLEYTAPSGAQADIDAAACIHCEPPSWRCCS